MRRMDEVVEGGRSRDQSFFHRMSLSSGFYMLCERV